jgi:hypothetical protein
MRMDRTCAEFPNSLEYRSMVLRLILVSMVAGLGLTPPAEGQMAGWSRAVQTWLDARLADWDGAPALVESVRASSAGELASDFEIAAWELEILATYGDPPATTAPATTPIADHPSDRDRDFSAIIDEMVADFCQEITSRCTTETKVPAPVPASGVAATAAEIADLEAAIVAEELAAGEPSAIVQDPPMGVLPAGEDAPFEIDLDYVPLESSDTRLDETIPAASAPADDQRSLGTAPDVAPAGNPFRDAVRLTRDAVFAWINLLQSPALLTVAE